MSDAIQQFRDALAGRGIIPPVDLVTDGRIHRCDAEGPSGKSDAAYLLHLDGIPAGGFENWRDGLGWQNWRADMGRTPTPAEEAAYRAKIEQAGRQREAEKLAASAEAQERASRLWQEAKPCAEHAYLTRKGIATNGARLHGERLVLPIRDTAGVLHSLQFIGPDGEKRYLSGGRIRGCYFSIGKPDGVLCIAEGFATGASIHEATGYAVAVAFDAGNLQPAGEALREKFPDQRLIVCADDDFRTAGNPGMTRAKEAAQAVGGMLAVPDFGSDRAPHMTDFNDMALSFGLEAVARAVEGATKPPMNEPQLDNDAASPGESAQVVNLTRASDVKLEAITWLWKNWLAVGKFHICGGAPGTGKTTISMSLAATVTTGGRWPDGTQSIAGNVVIWSGEDGPADTLIPRLALAGADLSRIYFIDDIREGKKRRSFDPAHDMGSLRRKLGEIGDVKLLIVDPVVSAIAGDSHKNAEVRRGLQPLVDLADSMRCALLGITHFSKGTGGRDPVERLTGSLAFGALPRVVLVAAKHQQEGDDGRTARLLCRAKSNIGPDGDGFEYDLHHAELKTHPGIVASAVQWGEAVEGTARALLAKADATGDDGKNSTLDDAKRFLADLLADGPRPQKIIEADAKAAGHSLATIRRAQKALGIKPEKEGMKAGWVWRMPDQDAAQAILPNVKMLKNPEDAQQKEVSNFGKIEHLRGNPDEVEVEI